MRLRPPCLSPAEERTSGSTSARANLGHVAYSLYSIERVGMFLDIQQIGGLRLVSGGGVRPADPTRLQRSAIDAANMALDPAVPRQGEHAHRHRQVALQGGDWNNDHRDVKNWIKVGSTSRKAG